MYFIDANSIVLFFHILHISFLVPHYVSDVILYYNALSKMAII